MDTYGQICTLEEELTSARRQTLNLYPRAQRKTRRTQCAACGIRLCPENAPDFVERWPLIHVGKHDRALHYIHRRTAVRDQN